MGKVVFVTGSTGYVGTRLIRTLLAREHAVRALARPASVPRLPPGCVSIAGDALDARTFEERIAPADTLVHLVGVPHPNPSKARQFREVDLEAARASSLAASRAGVGHFVFLSVAQPAPVMKAYQAVRREAEALVIATGIPATIVRPWYILGPGHWWPVLLLPLYAALERFPATRQGARRLGLVTLDQIVRLLVDVVEHPASGVRIVEVPEIRRGTVARGTRVGEAMNA
jgi:uncharacterized protein YbjT (DUF2867 family)